MNNPSVKFIDIYPLLLMLSLLFLGVAAESVISDKFGSNLNIPYLILRLMEFMTVLFIMFYVQTLIHEAGHFIAGLIRGWTFLSFVFVNVMLSSRNGKLNVSRYYIPGAVGQCIMVPPEEGDTYWGIALYNSGGIILNVLTGLLSLLLLSALYDFWGYEAALILMCSSFWGIILAVQNAVPMISGGLPNDGENIKELYKDNFSKDVFVKSLHIVSVMQNGNIIKNLPEKYMCDGIVLDYTMPMHTMALNFDLKTALAKKDFCKAGEIVHSVMSDRRHVVKTYIKEFKREYLFLALINHSDKFKINNLLDAEMCSDIKKLADTRPEYMRLNYTIARLYEHDEKKALAIYIRFHKLFRKYHSVGEVYYEKELIELVRNIPL